MLSSHVPSSSGLRNAGIVCMACISLLKLKMIHDSMVVMHCEVPCTPWPSCSEHVRRLCWQHDTLKPLLCSAGPMATLSITQVERAPLALRRIPVQTVAPTPIPTEAMADSSLSLSTQPSGRCAESTPIFLLCTLTQVIAAAVQG